MGQLRVDALRRSRFVLLVGCVVLISASAWGQQAIVSMPSADITPTGQFFAMHETQTRPWGNDPYWAGTYFLTYGLVPQVELAATLFDFGVSRRGSTGTSVIAVGLKANVELAPDAPSRPTLTFGAMGLASTVGLGVGAWSYALGSVVTPLTRTRLASGLSYAGDPLLGAGKESVSVMASIEQPLPFVHGLSLVAEWFSGTHELSNLIVGATWHPNETFIFVLGWKIPTKDHVLRLSEQAVVAEVGLFFPKRWP